MKDVIADFKSSDAPQFKGKSDKKKKEMAIAAKLSKEEFEIDESTKEYAKSLDKIANDRTLKMLTKSERENLKKIADLLSKEEFEIEEALMKPDMLATLKKKYESLRGKRLSLGQNMEIAKIVSGMSRDKEVLLQLVKADIPFISLNAATLLMDKHGMKAKDINLTSEEVTEGNSAYDKQIAAFIAKGGKIKKLSVNKKEISKAAAEFKKKFKTMQQKEIELDIEDELERARNEEVEVAEAFKSHKMYDPKTGKAYDADTEEDHLKYKKIGYTHEKPQVEALEKEGAAEFMDAASAAKKEGKKKFKFGGKEYPVTIKVDIPLANEEIANSVGGGGIAGLDIGLTAKKKKEDTDKAKALRKKMVGEEVQRTTFAGKDVFIVDSETYYNCRLGKKKYGRYEKYVGNGEVGQTIREYGLKYPRRPIILQNGESGPMLFLKYGRS